MSHAVSGSEERADPNLTPLLDVVLQLLMFFMMCVNFVSEQVNEDIKLPVAQSARPMDKRVGEVLVLNMDAQGQLIVLGHQQPLRTPGEVSFYLKQEYQDARRNAESHGDRTGRVNTAIVIRAHRDSNYANVYNLLRTCKEIGYRKLQLRAMTRGD
jgi:biopolymer transport protein ExbD